MLIFRRTVVLVDIIVVFAYSDTPNQNHRWANVLLVLIQVKYEHDVEYCDIRGVFIKFPESLLIFLFISTLSWNYNYSEDKSKLSRIVNFDNDWHHTLTTAVAMITSCYGKRSNNCNANINANFYKHEIDTFLFQQSVWWNSTHASWLQLIVLSDHT